MKRVAFALTVLLGLLLVGASERGVQIGVPEVAAGGKCIPDGGKCAGSQLLCCNKPCTNGVCRN